jgi:hypothetical protein
MVRVAELPDLEHKKCAPRYPRGYLDIITDEFGRCSWELLVPLYIITTNVAATSSA